MQQRLVFTDASLKAMTSVANTHAAALEAQAGGAVDAADAALRAGKELLASVAALREELAPVRTLAADVHELKRQVGVLQAEFSKIA